MEDISKEVEQKKITNKLEGMREENLKGKKARNISLFNKHNQNNSLSKNPSPKNI